MLCATRKSDLAKVIAAETTKAEAPFVCPECAKDVILRKCRTKVDHFAHKPPVTCQYGAGETEAHRTCKTAIYDALKQSPNVTKLELERHLKEVRPDVSCYINGVPVAIEVQISALPYDTILKRTAWYAQKKIYLLWVAQWNPYLDSGDRYSPRLWEKWFHAAYFGRVYYWTTERLVVPYHFGPCLIDVPLSEWHDSSGDEVSAGGYTKYSKRYRMPEEGRPLDIAADFVKCEHGGFNGGVIQIPPCKLFKDRFGKWEKLKLPPPKSDPPAAPARNEPHGEDMEEDDSCPW